MAKRNSHNHPKIKRLARALKTNRRDAFGLMCILWDFTTATCWHGNIGKYSDEELADEVFWEEDPAVLILALVESGLVDLHEGHRLIVHDWWDHAEDSVHMKIARAHEFFADGRAPKLGRLSKDERAPIADFYADAATEKLAALEFDRAHEQEERAHDVRTETESVRTTMPCLAKPSQAIPSQAEPPAARTPARGGPDDGGVVTALPPGAEGGGTDGSLALAGQQPEPLSGLGGSPTGISNPPRKAKGPTLKVVSNAPDPNLGQQEASFIRQHASGNLADMARAKELGITVGELRALRASGKDPP